MKLPDLSNAKQIGIDIETYDPEIKKKGPGVRRDGYIIGISVAIPEGKSWYLPINHQGGGNLDRQAVINWAKENLTRAHQPKVGANILYDLDYLYHAGIKVQGKFYDVQVAEPLINENKMFYNLESLAQEYLNTGKEESGLIKTAKRYGIAEKDIKSSLWKFHAEDVAPYAKADALLPMQILKKQLKVLEGQDLLELFDLETRLLPLVLHIRRRGVKIDIEKAKNMHKLFDQNKKRDTTRLRKLTGMDIEIFAADSVAKAFDLFGYKYNYTQKTGRPSFTTNFLENHNSDLSNLILALRKWSKFNTTFVNGILDNLVGDRIHCQFHPLKNDEYGTVSGRFSSSNPNLQQVPKRDKELGALMRGIFIPDDGELWGRYDYSQIEYRLLAHYAVGAGAEEAREMYRKNPDTDFHQMCADMAGIPRSPAKGINFGVVFGMGKSATARNLNMSLEDATLFLREYDSKLPFVKNTYYEVMKVANRRGYIRTVLNRRARFDRWESRQFREGHKKTYTKKEAHEKHGNSIQRAFTYTALNRLTQGSGADILKKAMVDIWESGICDTIGVPLITLHDELDFSVPKTKKAEEAFAEAGRIMCNVVKLKVPLNAEKQLVAHWGECG